MTNYLNLGFLQLDLSEDHTKNSWWFSGSSSSLHEIVCFMLHVINIFPEQRAYQIWGL